jgi:nucleotide-binding universal stress UspA family protein
MDKLLIPTTFSEIDWSTRLYGIHLAKAEGYEVHLIHVLEDYSYNPPQPNIGYVPFQTNTATIMARKIYSEMAYNAFWKNILRTVKDPPTMKFHTEMGSKSSVILSTAQEIDAKMIILTGKEEKKESIFSLTSLDDEIIRDSPVPVWIIAPGSEYQRIGHIVLATDFNEGDIDAIDELIPMAKRNNARITALHITRDEEFEEKLMKRGFLEIARERTGYDRIKFAIIHDKGDREVAELINEFVRGEKADLVSVIKQNKSFFDRLFRKSTTRSLAYHSDKPVVVFHQKDK